MRNVSQRKATMLAILAVLFWSTSPTAFKLGLRYQDNYQLLTGAALTSTVILGLMGLLSGRRKRFLDIRGWDLGFSAIMGIMNPVAYYLILFKAYSILPAQVAQPLNMVWPIVLVLISIPLLRQKIGWKSLAAMALSFLGVVVVSIQGGSAGSNPENRLGIFLALSTSIIWALYFLLNARKPNDPLIRLFYNFLFASVYLLAGGFFRGGSLPASGFAWLSAAYVGIFEMGVTFVLWLMALQAAPTTDRISNLVYLAPFLNLGIVHLVLKEQIFGTTIIGIILLVSGIMIQRFAGKNEQSD